MATRNGQYQSEAYQKVRRQALIRDNRQCRKCGSRSKLEVHHIKKWADYPTLRHELTNLICLCRKCHREMWGKEEDWEGLCMSLLNQEKALDINYLMWKLKQEEEEDGDG